MRDRLRLSAWSVGENFLLTDEDRHFREEVRCLLKAELLPRAAAIEAHEDWASVKAAVRCVGQAGHLKRIFSDLYEGSLAHPGLTPATKWKSQKEQCL